MLGGHQVSDRNPLGLLKTMAGASTQVSWPQVQAAFQRIWGYPQFRPPQDSIIRSLLDQRDTLVVLPTGGGKSLCFQLPALLQQGVTLVISPLVALMEDQVQDLRQRGLAAAALHSELAPRDRRQVLRDLSAQRLRLLYLSPEGLLSPPVWERLCQPDLVLNGLILDEAHCLVQWGDTFRPAYRRLGAVRPALLAQRPPGTPLPIAAFTATADPQAQAVIRSVLQLQEPQVVRLSPYRANLHLGVKTVWTPQMRQQALGQFIHAQGQQAGLVYVRTRRDSETLAATLAQRGHRVAPYHAGLSARDRRQREAAWLGDGLQFVVCTNAFGMGVNKPNVRWVAHFHAPALLTEYVQEVGRAGRDGHPARALTLVSEPTGLLDPSDRQRSQFFARQEISLRQRATALAQQLPAQGTVAAVQSQFKDGAIALAYLHSQGQLTWIDPFQYRLRPAPPATAAPGEDPAQAMHRYLHGGDCRWQTILTRFGFRGDAQRLGACGHCDRCHRRSRHL
ncbi:MAG: ATP-dependent DNA helicase RecQ [Leptolyngbya sp.]|nr:ATP-dependent DNA helicase RecQ [Leptolyngbya sp.]